MTEVKLDIGGGKYPKPGYLSLDVTPNADIHHDLLANGFVHPFKNNEVDAIYASHFIEHMEYDDSIAWLKDCKRVLKPGGVIEIHTVDTNVVMQRLEACEVLPDEHRKFKKCDPSLRHIHVAQFRVFHCTPKNHYQNHKSLWTQDVLTVTLQYAGFTVEPCDINPLHKNYDLAAKGFKR